MKVIALLSFLIAFLFISSSFAADRIRIGYSGLSPATAMLWVTQEGKLLERNGLNPEVLFLRNNLGQSAMIAGEIDMCSYSASLLAPARVQGADLVMIVSFQQKLNYRLVVRPEIRTLAELKGKVLGVTRYGTVNDATMRLLLNKLGVDPGAGCPIDSSRRFRSGGSDFVDRGQNLRRRAASAAVLQQSRRSRDARVRQHGGDGYSVSAGGLNTTQSILPKTLTWCAEWSSRSSKASS